ncbi:TlpA family protein disulfide reductase [Noviherbaspirillum cavernae]|uniref:TlpA family protein disulfide reductase n=1 Tax=Noviherbaspirillum cavernae TaxID=2320862 RepID=A0A418X047_9BURK|nr:TlpA disulfide reductase family protein [Noviherbaspirillum cavernae]RJG05695.1 TlpA family protein disulfide reductase [Noviherbaspirillum cavernae]
MKADIVKRICAFLVLLPLLMFVGGLHAAGARVGDVPVLPALRTLDGTIINPAKLRGKVVVLSYFSSTCPFCMNEAPKLQKLYRDNADKLIVIGVNIEDKDPEQKSKALIWVEKYKLMHPVTTDFSALERVLGKRKGLPVNYVFDKQGRLHRVDVGEIFDEDFDDIARFAREK